MSEHMFYVAIAPECGCMRASVVDEPMFKFDTAKSVARLIKEGYEVRRVNGTVMAEGMRHNKCPVTPCPNPRNKRSAK